MDWAGQAKRWRWAILAVVISLFALPALAAEFRGKVVGITDGDTITVLRDGNVQVKVRLTEVDAPEGGQAWGQRSKQTLSKLVFGKQVRVVWTEEDRWGRTLGRVYVGGLDVSAEMARSGAAWAFLRYLTDRRMITLEAEAKKARLGLWSMPANQIIAPWDYRAGVRVGSVVFSEPAGARPARSSDRGASRAPQSFSGARAESGGSGGFGACGSKRYCSEMSSCAEARYYLRQCGLSRLDGNNDGVPCEKLC